MIKDFVPARTNLRSGIVVKQHLLERNKYPQPQTSWEDVTYSGSIDTAFFSGSTGGTFNEFNILVPSQTFPIILSGSFAVSSSTAVNYFLASSSVVSVTNTNPNQTYVSEGSIVTDFDGNITLFFSGSKTIGGNVIEFDISSSLKGGILNSAQGGTGFNVITSIIPCTYGEVFTLTMYDQSGTLFSNVGVQFGIQTIYEYSPQTWYETTLGPTGSARLRNSDQREFYNGELPGTIIEATNGELNEANVFKYPSTLEINYDIVFYKSDITPLNNFLNINTSPDQGEIYLYYDTGSFLSYQDAGLTPAIRQR
jgi:hypothetical protein